MELMKQKQYSPMNVAEMSLSLFAAEHGYLDDLKLEEVGAFEHALHSFANNEKKDLMDAVNADGEYGDQVEQGFHALIKGIHGQPHVVTARIRHRGT